MNFLRFITVVCLAFILVTLHSCGSDRVDLIADLGLIKGHLIVGEELLQKGNPLMAEPHFGHPIKELYDNLESPLKNRQANFKEELDDLAKKVERSPSDLSVEGDLDKIYAKIDNLIAGEQKAQPKLKAISQIIKQAIMEYEEGVKQVAEKRKVITYPEYQDARGFVAYVKELFKSIPGQSEQKESDVIESLDKLLEMLPLNPPEFVDNYDGVLLKAKSLIEILEKE